MSGSESAARAAPSLARGAAGATLATAASRLTGFVRVVVVASAMGTTFLANTYQTANTAPNLIFELVAAGVLTSIFVPTFVDYLVRGQREEGWAAANALTSVALVGLVAIAVALGLAAPLVMRGLTAGVETPALREAEIALGTSFLRLFAPQVVFYGLGMIATAALHAHRRFVLPAAAPIFNNVIVIGVYLTYAAMRGDRPPAVGTVDPAEVWVLGAGTTAGVVAMTLCLWPRVRRLGWRWRFAPSMAHPAVRKGLRVGGWALGYAGGYQAGLIVVLFLANKIQGGVAAYQWAYTFFYLPYALFAVPIFSALFTAMSEFAARREPERIEEALRRGLALLAFLLVPVAALLLAGATQIARTTLEYGVMTVDGSALVGRVLGAFALGLPGYSFFLVYTRAFYALGDARTPAIVNVGTVALASLVGAVLFVSVPSRWAVPGLAAGHTIGFTIGAGVLGAALGRRLGSVGRGRLGPALVRAGLVGALSLAVMVGASRAGPEVSSPASAAASIALMAAAGGASYLLAMTFLKAPELEMIRRTLGRRSA